MTNINVVTGWIDAMINLNGYSPKCLHSSSMHADGIYLISYATPIAKFYNGKFQLTNRKYSVTTTKHQNLIRDFVPHGMLAIVEDINCPDNAYPWKWSGK